MKRTLPIAVASLVLAGASMFGQAGAVVPGRSALAQAAAQSLAARIGHGRGRRRPGSHLGRAPRLRLDDRAHRDRRGHHAEDRRRVLRAGAAGARVRRRPATSSATGAARARYDWPVSPGGIAVDAKGSVWITAAGPPEIPGGGNATPPAAGRGGGRRDRRSARAGGGERPSRRRRRRRSRRTRTSSSSRARESSCCRSARPARPAPTTAPRRSTGPPASTWMRPDPRSTSPTAT